MKQFLFQCSLFVALLAFLGVGLEYMLRSVPNSYAYKRSLIEASPQKVKYLFIGNSVIAHGINPACFADSTLNIAFPGQHVHYNKVLLEKYIDRLSHIKSIYWGISYESLWEYEDGGPHTPAKDDLLAYYHIYLGLPSASLWRHRSELLATGDLAFKKWWKYYIAGKPTMQCDSLGLDHSMDGKKKKLITRTKVRQLVTKHTLFRKKDASLFYQNNVEALRETARLCARKGIRFYLVIPPVGKLYAQEINQEQWMSIQRTLDDLKQNEQVEVCNYFYDPRFEENDFYDANHLNSSQGACKLARILRKETLESLSPSVVLPESKRQEEEPTGITQSEPLKNIESLTR